MPIPRRRGGEAASSRPRRRRPRPTPKWLRQAQDLDAIGKARCLLVLDVLSGQTPVTDAIQAGKLSRGTYYQLETRALQAMLGALTPGVVTETGAAADRVAAARRIATLEGQVRRLEQGKRRAERLLVLTRKVIQPGRLTTAGPKPGRRRSTPAGASASPRRPTRPAASPRPSTPTPGGGGGC
jgi:hypothetical protein